ncbi:hypothetical protein FKM82_020467 [Ascaphus truei]
MSLQVALLPHQLNDHASHTMDAGKYHAGGTDFTVGPRIDFTCGRRRLQFGRRDPNHRWKIWVPAVGLALSSHRETRFGEVLLGWGWRGSSPYTFFQNTLVAVYVFLWLAGIFGGYKL